MTDQAAFVPDACPPRLRRAWSSTLRWLRVIWVCRVPASSAALATFLFWNEEAARDLFLESIPYPAYWFVFFALVLLWAVIVHYSARKLLEQQAWAARGAPLPLGAERAGLLRHRYAGPGTWVPRLLGGWCILAVGIGICKAHQDVAPIIGPFELTDPAVLLPGVAACGALFAAYAVFRRPLTEPGRFGGGLGRIAREAARSDARRILVEPSAFWFFDLLGAGRGEHRRPAPGWDLAALGLLVLQALAFVAAISAPHALAFLVSRAQFVIAILALPVATFSFLTALSHQWRVPVLLGVLLALSALTGSRAHFHDLRVLGPPAETRQASLREAVDAWQHSNCPGKSGQECGVRPVIVASAGGASRAAFFSATVIGALLDDARLDFRHRLFAISGVSGGAVGAAIIRSALADAGPDGEPPCDRIDSMWWGPYRDYGGTSGKRIGWKECLQAIAAGDFLSPAIVGLAFRDLFGFAGLSDRAVLLEEAVERRYRRLVPDGRGALTRPLSMVESSPAMPWIPLVMLNATSVSDGRRVIFSDLSPSACDEPAGRLFPMAYDAFEIASRSVVDCRRGVPARSLGVRVSTAAVASARFPVVSPQALIWEGPDAAQAEQVVDGGYFENDGLTTAAELAKALHDRGLDAIILRVTNDPRAGTNPTDPLPVRPAPSWTDAYRAPLDALIGTRSGHADEAAHAAGAIARTLELRVHRSVPILSEHAACSFDSPGTITDGGPLMRDVSMSWWLSGAVQEYLDRQLCHPDNAKAVSLLRQWSAEARPSH